MKTYEEKKRFIAYKLLEWAGQVPDRVTFENMSDSPSKRIVLEEAESILQKIGVSRKEGIEEGK